eukprot:2626492-Karenia_brevis.AAC.1
MKDEGKLVYFWLEGGSNKFTSLFFSCPIASEPGDAHMHLQDGKLMDVKTIRKGIKIPVLINECDINEGDAVLNVEWRRKTSKTVVPVEMDNPKRLSASSGPSAARSAGEPVKKRLKR